MPIKNVYSDSRLAGDYAKLEFPNTYYLAFRDLPAIMAEHATGTRAIDFGCGAGRSTRFLKQCGFSPIGIDISEEMIRLAKQTDPSGDYRHTADGDFSQFASGTIDLVLAAFTFDNIPTREKKLWIFQEIARLLKKSGRLIVLVSAPELYLHDWASFTCTCFPENRTAKTGEIVRTMMKDIPDKRPIDDILWPDEAYHEVTSAAGLTIIKKYRPLGNADEPYVWVNETTIAPWVIYVLRSAAC